MPLSLLSWNAIWVPMLSVLYGKRTGDMQFLRFKHLKYLFFNQENEK